MRTFVLLNQGLGCWDWLDLQFTTSSSGGVLSLFPSCLCPCGRTLLSCERASGSKVVAHASLFVSKGGDEDTSPTDVKYSFFPSVLLGPNAMSHWFIGIFWVRLADILVIASRMPLGISSSFTYQERHNF